MSEHDHTFANHNQKFTGFEVDFSKIAGQTDKQTDISDHWAYCTHQ